MILSFTSGRDIRDITTNGYSSEMLIETIFNTIQEIWNPENRKSGNSLRISDGTTAVLIGRNMYGHGKIEWYNPSAKTGGNISHNVNVTKNTWCDVFNFIYRFFGIPYSDDGLRDLESFELNEIVNSYQPQIDNLIREIELACRYGINNYWYERDRRHVETVLDYLKQIRAICDHVLETLSDYTGCDMVPDDGYYPDLSGLAAMFGSSKLSCGEFDTALSDTIYDYETLLESLDETDDEAAA